MSDIQIPEDCPRCHTGKAFVIAKQHVYCRMCGYQLRDAAGKPVKPPERHIPEAIKRRKLRPSYRVTTRGDISEWARAAFNTGMDCVRKEDWEGAIDAFKRAIDNEKEFLDAYLWVAYVSDDPEVKREYLTALLAYEPGHIEATQELMILDGELDAATIDHMRPHAEANVRQAGGAVTLESQNLRCPRCGSTEMTTDDMTGLAFCGSCGHAESRDSKPRKLANNNLAGALLKRRYQPVVWKVGEHYLECDSCGAKRTIPAQKLSSTCPFCGSKHVFERDVLDTFQQPDGLLPFRIPRSEAGRLLREKVESWTQRLMGIFDNNRVKRSVIEPIFLPYWVFDAAVDVRQTTVRDNPYEAAREQYGSNYVNPLPGYESNTTPDAVNNVLVCGVDSPSPRLTRRLGEFNLDEVMDYDPKLLAKYPAELYSIDFDKASLRARQYIGDIMRSKYENRSTGTTRINVYSQVKYMNFRLLLLPVWVVTLFEEDGDVRPALVNGQTGEVVLGKANKLE